MSNNSRARKRNSKANEASSSKTPTDANNTPSTDKKVTKSPEDATTPTAIAASTPTPSTPTPATTKDVSTNVSSSNGDVNEFKYDAIAEARRLANLIRSQRLAKQAAAEASKQDHETDAQQHHEITADDLLPAPVTREAIAQLQREQSTQFQQRLTQLLKAYLPPRAFVQDPSHRHRGDPTGPTLLAIEVSRAQGDAELNVYLSYCRGLDRKHEFLAEYKALRDECFGVGSEVNRAMRRLAKMYPDAREGDDDDAEREAGGAGGKSRVHREFAGKSFLNVAREELEKLRVEKEGVGRAGGGGLGAKMVE